MKGSSSPQTSSGVRTADKGLFYNFDSFIPLRYKLNKILTLVYRMYRIASRMYIFDLDVKSLKHRLMKNGFSSTSLKDALKRCLTSTMLELMIKKMKMITER